MRKSIETYQELADILCSVACYTTAARRIGVSAASVFRWLADSKKAENDKSEDFLFAWAGETDYLHRHCGRAVRIQCAAVEGYARHRALHGHDEPVFYQGRPSLRVRPDILRNGDADADADTLEILYGVRTPYELDSSGRPVQEVMHHAPSDGLVSMVLKAHLPKLYGTKIEQTVTHGGGVLVVGARAAAPVALRPVEAPRAIEHVEAERVEPVEHDREHVEQEMVSTDEDLDPEALRAGYSPDDDEPDDLPEPPRAVAPPRPRPDGLDADMARHGEGIGYAEPAGGGFKVL
jgi:hypothetical protein